MQHVLVECNSYQQESMAFIMFQGYQVKTSIYIHQVPEKQIEDTTMYMQIIKREKI